MLFVTPSPGAKIDADALADFVQAGVMEPPARPRAIHFIDEMPVTPVGKIYKPRLREIAAEAAARDALKTALAGAPFEVEARHAERGLTLTAKVSAEPQSRLRAANSASCRSRSRSRGYDQPRASDRQMRRMNCVDRFRAF